MKTGLLGRRLGHSLSPVLHRIFGDDTYRLYEREPEDVEDFLRHGEASALNVTIPYKKVAAAHCDALSPQARRLGNVNVVLRRPDGTLYGDNTDYAGFRRLLETTVGNLSELGGRECSILGAGGAAMTAQHVLTDLGAHAFVNHRGDSPHLDAELIVNATPVGMWPNGDTMPVDLADYPRCRHVLDLVYNPSPTKLVRAARARGITASDGLVMLVAQAAAAHELFLSTVTRASPSKETNSEYNPKDSKGSKNPIVYLYGAPGSGKSTLGRAVARALGWCFIDLDAEIERRAGCTIPALFQQGEAVFRAQEKSALADVAGRAVRDADRAVPTVVALGGGALLDPENAALARASGRVVVLEADSETLWERVRATTERPLARDRDKFFKLLAERKDHYALFRT